MPCQELTELQLVVLENVHNPLWCLWEVGQRLAHLRPQQSVVRWLVWYLVKLNLGTQKTVTSQED